MSTLRTFVAVEIAPDIRSRAGALINRLKGTDAKVTWVPPESLHFTLQFLGDVVELQLPAVCKAVAEGAAAIEPFDLEVQGLGAFPSLARPRTLWLGVTQGAKAMAALQSSIEDRLLELGFEPERRPYKPHLTLGRVRHATADLTPLIEKYRDHLAGTGYVDEVTVFSSDLTRDGAIHTPMAHCPLRRETEG